MTYEQTKVNVDFSLVGDDFNPEYISKMLKLEPTEVLKKGEFLIGRKIPNIETTWSIQTGFEPSLDIKDQLIKIINQLIGKKEVLQKLCLELPMRPVFQVTVLVKNQEIPVIYLDSIALEFISSIGATIDIDIDV